MSPSWHCFTGTASRRTVALSEPRAERAAGPRERAVRTLQGAPHRTIESLRTDRSLRPSFWRTPAPVRGSECASGRTVALSEPRAERAAGPRERAVRTLQGAPHRTMESLRTDRSLRPSFWRTPAPVRGSEPASGRTVALSATRERAAPKPGFPLALAPRLAFWPSRPSRHKPSAAWNQRVSHGALAPPCDTLCCGDTSLWPELPRLDRTAFSRAAASARLLQTRQPRRFGGRIADVPR